MDVLNLDQLIGKTRTLTLGGKSYKVDGMSVDNFIKSTLEAEEMEEKEKKGGVKLTEKIEATIRQVKRSIPDLPEEELRKLSIEQVGLISKFIRGDLDEAKEIVSDDGEAKN